MRANPWRGVTAIVVGLAVLPACGALRGGKVAPPQVVDMDPEVLHKFQKEVEEYVDLHQDLLKRIPTVTPQSTAEEIQAHRKKMTDAIRAERAAEKQGAIFKPKVAAAFKELIRKELAGPAGPAILEEMQSGNPKVEGTPTQQNPTREVQTRVPVAVNAVYPDNAPSSGVPSSLLLRMPPLPEQVVYGFVGRALILRDTEAAVILDFVPDAVADARLPR
jgi:hypothetical protein